MMKLRTRVVNAADRLELRAYLSAMRGAACLDKVGRAAIRHGKSAAKKFRTARQMRLALEAREQATVREKKAILSAASKEFNRTAPWQKRPKRKAPHGA